MLIQVENLVKNYDGHTVLDGLNFELEVGDIFGFLGPNGAGKTTTIRILTAIIKADSGNVLIDGHDVFKEPLAVKKISNALLESSGYYEWMTAGEYLRFFSHLYDLQKSDSDFQELLEEVGLQGRAGQLLGRFSRGMKQRLGIARALINKPKLLFLDEPTNGLDPQGRRDILNLLKGLNKKEGTTVFISTHLLDDVERLCNKIAIIHYGKINHAEKWDGGKVPIEELFFSSTREGRP